MTLEIPYGPDSTLEGLTRRACKKLGGDIQLSKGLTCEETFQD